MYISIYTYITPKNGNKQWITGVMTPLTGVEMAKWVSEQHSITHHIPRHAVLRFDTDMIHCRYNSLSIHIYIYI